MARYAALDIGSNSVRLQVAEVVPPEPPRILAAERQVTRLGESVFREGRISEQALELLMAVIGQMMTTASAYHVLGTRAVATSAARDARNQLEFLDRVSRLIGLPVEIISGQEEARLIHLGVQTRWPHPEQRILIVDVGGGSAELILSERGQMQQGVSRQLGAVRLQEVFLHSEPPDPQEIHRLEEFIDEKLAPVWQRLGRGPLDRVIGTSASAAALVCAVNRIPRERRESADRKRAATVEIRKLYRRLCARDLAGRRKITGIGPRRAEVIIPGVALLLKALEASQSPAIHYSAAGVIDGIIADLAARGVGREITRLDREQRSTAEQMARRCGVPLAHARKVAHLSHQLFLSLMPLHQLPAPYGRLLEAAAFLHDTGHFVSDTRHHKHSYYLVANSDMPGFTKLERELIANLCRYHRKSMPTPLHPEYMALPPEERQALHKLIPLLRLADNLDRSQEQRVDRLQCALRDQQVVLTLHSQSDIDLEQWAGEQVAPVFQQVYQRSLLFERGESTDE